jgi:hypothetical protein
MKKIVPARSNWSVETRGEQSDIDQHNLLESKNLGNV